MRLAVLENNPEGLAFRTDLGYETTGHRPGLHKGRPCTVLRKPLRAQEVERAGVRPDNSRGGTVPVSREAVPSHSCPGFPSPYSQSRQIGAKSLPGACFSTNAVKSAVFALP